MKRTLIPSLLLALMLSACGGGGGSGSAPADGSQAGGGGGGGGGQDGGGNGQTPPPDSGGGALLASQPQRIAYYGDSTIEGCRSGTQCGDGELVAEPAPLVFENYLRSRAPTAQSVSNEGVSGQTACGLRDDDWAGKMASSDATVVILNHGINDANQLSQERYRDCLAAIAETARNAGKRVIFETPNPVDNEVLPGYVDVMRRVAAEQGLNVIDQYAKWDAELEQAATEEPEKERGQLLRDRQSPDGTHPSESFYRRKGEYAAEEYLKLPL